ncbi:hypothetical protein [Micromonospora sp. NPDC004551]|uniref:hypothetical protein n=1 Tax=Micromonospora sp. NPDC004551 TaxID=3154284 RepID=UPI0033BBB43E
MVTRLAGVLLRAAARRWPAELRTELIREWDAELHVLAGRGERWRMLGFAASLAARRAGAPVVDRGVLHRRLWRTAGVLLLAPPACAAIVVLAALTSLACAALGAHVAWATALQMPFLSGLTAGAGALLALLVTRSARRTVRTGPLATALGVVLPIGLTVTVVVAAFAGRGEQGLPGTVPGLLLWLALLVPALWGAGILARRGRTRLAWAVGVLGALVAADAAVVLAVVSAIPAVPVGPVADGAPPDTVDRVSAPLWLLTCWTDSSLGLPRPTAWERFLITDRVLVEPVFYLACTPYAVAYAVAAARPAPAAEPMPEPVPAPA